MTRMPAKPGQERTSDAGLGRFADELKRESERLRQLADELEARVEALAEMLTNYPHFKRVIYAALQQQFEREIPPLPDKDLEEVATEEGAVPFEEFIHDLERPAGNH